MGKNSSEECRGLCEISVLLREVYENCALLGYYTASNGNLLLTFRNNLSVNLHGPSLLWRVLRCCSGFNTEIRRKIARQFVQERL